MSRSWKEFKKGEETQASIYVKRQFKIKQAVKVEDPIKKIDNNLPELPSPLKHKFDNSDEVNPIEIKAQKKPSGTIQKFEVEQPEIQNKPKKIAAAAKNHYAKEKPNNFVQEELNIDRLFIEHEENFNKIDDSEKPLKVVQEIKEEQRPILFEENVLQVPPEFPPAFPLQQAEINIDQLANDYKKNPDERFNFIQKALRNPKSMNMFIEEVILKTNIYRGRVRSNYQKDEEDLLATFKYFLKEKQDPHIIYEACSSLSKVKNQEIAAEFEEAINSMLKSEFKSLYIKPHPNIFALPLVDDEDPNTYNAQFKRLKDCIAIRKILCDNDERAGYNNVERLKFECMKLGLKEIYNNDLRDADSGLRLIEFLNSYYKCNNDPHWLYQACKNLSNSKNHFAKTFKTVLEVFDKSPFSELYYMEHQKDFTPFEKKPLEYAKSHSERYKIWSNICSALCDNETEEEAQKSVNLIRENLDEKKGHVPDVRMEPDVQLMRFFNYCYNCDINPRKIYEVCSSLHASHKKQAFKDALDVMDHSPFKDLFKPLA